MNCASGCWCVQRDRVKYVLSVARRRQFKWGFAGGGKGGRSKVESTRGRASMNSFPLSPVSRCGWRGGGCGGTSSEPITVVTRWQRVVLLWVLASGAVWLDVYVNYEERMKVWSMGTLLDKSVLLDGPSKMEFLCLSQTSLRAWTKTMVAHSYR